MSFANQTVNTESAAQTVSLSNTGVAAMAINGITITGANPKDFRLSTTCAASLGAGAACTISVVFKPTASGPRAASLNLSESDQVHPLQTVSLSGAGMVGVGQISSSLAFGAQLVNTPSSPQTVTLTNAGAALMSVGSIAITGANPAAFSETNNCGATLAPAASCAISVTFKPVAAGANSASLAIATSDPMNPALSVSLSGTGTTDFSLALAATSISVKSGSGATVNLTITSGSTFVGTIVLTCTGLPAHSTCSFSPATLNAAGDDTPLPSALTFATGLTTASVERRAATPLLAYWAGLPALGLAGLFILPMGNKARSRKKLWVVTALLGLLAFGMLIGCGGSPTSAPLSPPPASPATPIGSYSVTVTATAGNISHSSLMTLVVQ